MFTTQDYEKVQSIKTLDEPVIVALQEDPASPLTH
jgi:hypothetical protein